MGNCTPLKNDAFARRTNLSTFVYDAAGNLIAVVDPRGNRTTTAYDNLNRATQTTDALGDLSTSTTGSQLEELVGNWFLGTDHPQAAAGLVYLPAHGSLFGSGDPSPQDVVQG